MIHQLKTTDYGTKSFFLFSEINWSSQSPDLTAPDYFIWSFLEVKVYDNRPKTIADVKNNNVTKINTLGRQKLGLVMENTIKIVNSCEIENGRLLSYMIFHT